MKKILKRSLSVVLTFCIVFGSACISFGELDFSHDFSVKASAASESSPDSDWDMYGARYDSNNGYFVLTEDETWTSAIMWYKDTYYGDFSFSMDYYTGTKTSNGADGIAVFFYSNEYCDRPTGENLAFNGCEGYGVELDTYQNSYDPSYNHIALIKNSVSSHLKMTSLQESEDGKWHNLKIDVLKSVCYVYIDDALKFSYEITDIKNGHIGISAATGSLSNRHLVKNIQVSRANENRVILSGMPTLSDEDAVNFLSFLYNDKYGFKDVDIKNDIQYKLLTGNLSGDMSTEEILGLMTAFLTIVEVLTNKQITDSQYKVDYLFGILQTRLENELEGMSGLADSIISEQMGKISKYLKNGFTEIGTGIVWRVSGVRITEKHLDDIGNIFSGLKKTTDVASKINSMTNYAFAAVDLYGMVLGQENIARISYFNAYINFRDLDENSFQAAIDMAFSSIAMSYPLPACLDALTWITKKDSWTNHRDDIDRWAEYVYQLGQYQNQDFHDYRTEKHTVTCTTDGYTQYSCKYCDKAFAGDIVKSRGHKYVKTTVVPTCTTQGYDSYTCEICGDSYKDNYKEAQGHSVYEKEVVVPVCAKYGYTINYCKCGYKWISDQKSALSHDYTATVVEPTETKQGYTIHTCSNCGDVYYSGYVNPTSHRYKVSETSATCEQEGVITHTCDCGDVYTDTLPAKGHNYALESYDLPTCTKAGTKTYKCRNCDSTYTETVDAIAHNYTDKVEVVMPTCEEQGYTVSYCECGEKITTNTADATGHSYDVTSTVEATCTSEGSVTSECSVCGDVITETKPALGDGHKYELIESAEYTCTSNGYELYKCSTCGSQKYENLTVTQGHTCDTFEIVEPTCTESGTCSYVCTSCNESVTETVSANGHTKGEWEHSADGGKNEMIRKCTVCEEIVERSAELHTVTWHINGESITDWLPTGVVIAQPSAIAPTGYAFSSWYPETLPLAMGDEDLDYTAVFFNKTNNTFAADEYSFKVSDGVATLYGYLGNADEISLPETLAGVTVTGISAGALSGNLTQVTIPASITDINVGAFDSGLSLKKIFVDDKNTEYTAVDGVLYSKDESKLVRVPVSYECSFELSKKSSIIGARAFYKCKNFETITVPDSIKSIGTYAFANCENLTYIILSKDLESISDFAFGNCKKLSDVTIPDSVLTIGSSAFENCSELSSVKIGSKVTEIGSAAFQDCKKLSDVTIPDSVLTIGSSAFENCSELSSVKIGSKVTEIGSAAFQNCISLGEVIIPDSVTYIGSSAFRLCADLAKVNLPNSALDIKSYAFSETGITELTLPENIASIGNYAFSGCTDLKRLNYNAINCKLSVKNALNAMMQHPFKNTGNLTEVYIGKNVDTIPSQMFYGRGSITSVYTDDLKHWCSINFKSGNANPLSVAETFYVKGESITNLVIPEGVETINGYAFYKGTFIETVTVPDSVTSIGAQAFGYCSGLHSVTLSNGVNSIGANAFSNCTNLAEIEMPNSVVTIDATAFTEDTKTVLYCSANSTAHNFATDNNISFIANDSNTSVDLKKNIISTDCQNEAISNIMKLSNGLTYSVNSDVCGTGTVVDIMKEGVLHSQYTLVVRGDTNGDSVCDVLDSFDVEHAVNGNKSLSGVYSMAADSNSDNALDITDYQSIVNKTLAQGA